jgi:hypothetical protein
LYGALNVILQKHTGPPVPAAGSLFLFDFIPSARYGLSVRRNGLEGEIYRFTDGSFYHYKKYS